MLRGLSFKTRAKMAVVAAVLGLLVWADARGQECTDHGRSPGGATVSRDLADHGTVCPAR